jgi:hypothetical protein
MGNLKAMSESDLRAAAPSIFSNKAHDSRSARYAVVPTIDVLERLRKAGYVPTAASQNGMRRGDDKEKARRAPFVRHLIRLRHRDELDVSMRKVGDVVPEIVLLNSHDGTSAFRMEAGLYRLVCSNGLIVKNSSFGSIRLNHSGNALLESVIAAANDISSRLPDLMRITKEWDKIKLSPTQRNRFAREALNLRYNGNPPCDAATALTAQRNDDEAPTLWRTFNILQENLSRGGLDGKSATGRIIKTQSIKSVNNTLHFNRGLWEMAEAIAAR